MTYRFDIPQMGYPPIEGVLPVQAVIPPNPFWSRGFIVTAEDPVWGPGEFVFGQANGNIRLYGGCILTEVWDSTNKYYTYNFSEWPTTTNLGQPGFIYQGNVALTTGQYGWFMTSGRTPVNSTASIAANVAAAHNAAGQVTANAASLQLMNARVITPATQTVTASATSGNSGAFQIGLTSVAGFFVGGYISGTGVGTAAICQAIDPIGKTINVTVANSAAPSGTITCTYNNATIFYNVLSMNRMGLQGPIT